MKISFVVAVSENGVIGSHNAIPWLIPEDLKHFKDVTMGHTVLMGKHTFDSIMATLKKPLPGRTNVVITHQTDVKFPEGVVVYHSLEEALANIKTDELMVAGGGQIYQQLYDKGLVDKIYLTRVHKHIDGDVLFPNVDWSKWKETAREDHPEFSFIEYERQ
jgi:dihydrofolate reductase